MIENNRVMYIERLIDISCWELDDVTGTIGNYDFSCCKEACSGELGAVDPF